MRKETKLWPVYVPSYGRAGTSKTLEWLREIKTPVYVCIEANEFRQYADAYPGFKLVNNASGPGTIVGARQSILQHARESEFKWYWQIDDTVMGLAHRNIPQAKSYPDTVASLLELQALRELDPRVALIAPDFRHLAWSATTLFKLNTRCMVVVGTRTDTGVNYDLGLTMKEDLDFCLSTLCRGYVSVLSHLHEINEVPMGGNKTGGLVAKYAEPGFHERGCFDMIHKWPGFCRMDKPRHGRPEIKISWKTFLLKKNKV